jgi:methylglutaconyl-CoA hydratase
MVSKFVDELAKIDKNNDVRVVILTGSGKYFCSGMDLGGASSISKGEGGSTTFDDVANRGAKLFTAMTGLSKPIIALLNGPALGGGVGIVFASDIRIGLSDVWLQTPEVKRGIAPAFISAFITPQLGSFKSMEFLLTGRKISIQDANTMGFITSVCKTNEEMNEVAKSYITDFVEAAPGALARTKKLIHFVNNHSFEENIGAAKKAFIETVSGDEAKFGMMAFLQRQKADWRQLQSKL